MSGSLVNWLFITVVTLTLAVRDAKVIPVKVIQAPGQVSSSSSSPLQAVFLSKERLEIVENSGSKGKDGSSFLLCDVMPLLLDKSTDTISILSCKNVNLHNRDNYIFDNLPYSWSNDVLSKRDLFSLLQARPYTTSTFHKHLNDKLGMRISALVVEEKDRGRVDDAVQLGAAAIILRNTTNRNITEKEVENLQLGRKTQFAEDEISISVCHIDEMVSLAIGLSLPIFINKAMFESLCIDATLSQASSGTSLITATLPEIVNKRDNTANKDIIPAWEIFDPKTFFKLSLAEKRQTLKKSGVLQFPRPRLGTQVVDNMLLDLMDEAVRGEVLRQLQQQQSAQNDEQNTNDEEVTQSWTSARQLVLEQMGEALNNGNMKQAEQLRDKFIQMTIVRADPTQNKGSYDRYLDQDDWYLEARRKAMSSNSNKKNKET